jgi:hypothetical protein
VTTLAVACALLEIPVDPGRLYDSDDPAYLGWLGQVVEQVNSRHRAEAAKAKKK